MGSVDDAVKAYADGMMEHEIKYQKEFNSERFNRLMKDNPDAIEEFRERKRQDGVDLAENIREKSPVFMKRFRQGLLHMDNKLSRMLFEAVSGVQLPNNTSGAYRIIEEWCGDSLVQYDLARKEELERLEADRKAEEDRRRSEEIGKICSRISGGQPVCGTELLDIARHLSIDVHPRTAGTLKRRVRSIGGEGARISGKGTLPVSVWQILRDVKEKLQPALQE